MAMVTATTSSSRNQRCRRTPRGSHNCAFLLLSLLDRHRHRSAIVLVLVALWLLSASCASAFVYINNNNFETRNFDSRSTLRQAFKRRRGFVALNAKRLLNVPSQQPQEAQRKQNQQRYSSESATRRRVLSTAFAATLAVAANANRANALDDPIASAVAHGEWIPQKGGSAVATHNNRQQQNQQQQQHLKILPDAFCLYATRVLIHFDTEGVGAWWNSEVARVNLLSEECQRRQLTTALMGFAKSLQVGLEQQLADSLAVEGKSYAVAIVELYDRFAEAFAAPSLSSVDESNRRVEAARQIGLLFALLPSSLQPTARLMKSPALEATGTAAAAASDRTALSDYDFPPNRLVTLLPTGFKVQQQSPGSAFTIFPNVNTWDLADTCFSHRLADMEPLKRDLPDFSALTYALLGISGGTGCALTHTVVIPLDVVKTRAQTNPQEYADLLNGARKVFNDEGVSGLFLGAQATLAGYLWYGISVYPCYTLFKRLLMHGTSDAAFIAAHLTEIGLLAGALASVVAGFGLTPLEAARIRVVADPEKYRKLGLFGTMATIASEGDGRWQRLFDGLPSLLTRQVIFGSVKFLAFERACEFMFGQAPMLRDSTWTSLSVSLLAGALAGALSSIVSQPADSVLTYVARNSDGRLGVVQGSQVMIQQEGVGSLFRGLGSRCVWASTIIAGQFLLYDVFRTWFGVSASDLSEVYRVALLPVTTQS